jgi:hypothetical protein
VDGKGWHALQNCILGAAIADSSTMGAALGTFHQVATIGGHTISKSPLAETFEAVIKRHAPRGQGSEVAWALWGALAWSVSLSADIARAVSASDDDIVALLALDADSRGLLGARHGNEGWWLILFCAISLSV